MCCFKKSNIKLAIEIFIVKFVRLSSQHLETYLVESVMFWDSHGNKMKIPSCFITQVLMLSNNKFSEWPGAVLGSIPNLHELLLAYNPFREVHLTFSTISISILIWHILCYIVLCNSIYTLVVCGRVRIILAYVDYMSIIVALRCTDHVIVTTHGWF